MAQRPEKIRKTAKWPVCPCCGFSLVEEDKAFVARSEYDKKNRQSLTLGPVIDAVKNKYLEMMLFSVVGLKRPMYFVCTNKECPLNFSSKTPYYFKEVPGFKTGTLRGDLGGIGQMFLSMGYKRNPPKK